MNFDPNQKTQDKLTSKILIEHALAKCSLQKEVALTIGAEETRVSEWKKQKSRMPTDVANKVIEAYGSPVSAKGQYISDSKFVATLLDLKEYLTTNHNFQVSRLLEPIIQSLKWIYFPDRESSDSVTIIDIKINDFLNDARVIDHAIQMVKCWTARERHWTVCDEFKLRFEDLDRTRNIEGQESSIRMLISEFGLDEEFKDLASSKHNCASDLDKLTVVIYICAAIKSTSDVKECLLVSWNNKNGRYEYEEQTSELVISGEILVNDNYFDKEVLIFEKDKNMEPDYSNELLPYLKLLNTWLSRNINKVPLHLSRSMIRPYIDDSRRELFTKIDRLQVFYDKSRSCFTVSITINSINEINDLYRNPSSSLVLTDISTQELLNEVIPTLHSLHSSSVTIDWALSGVGTKGKLANMGVMIPGAIII